MSMFTIDTEIPYDKYLRWIYDHGTRIQIQSKEPSNLLRLAEVLLTSAENCIANNQPAMAYYYAVRSLQFLDDRKTGANLRKSHPQASSMMDKALNIVSDLEKGQLRESYSSAVKKLRVSEPDRLRVINRQLMTDNQMNSSVNTAVVNAPVAGGDVQDGSMASADKRAEYERKKQQLLAQEIVQNTQLASDLNLAMQASAKTASSTLFSPPAPQPSFSAASSTSLPRPQPSSSDRASVMLLHSNSSNAPQANHSHTSPATDRAPRQIAQDTSLPHTMSSVAQPLVSVSRYEAIRLNQPGVRRVATSRRGIINLGNTCYMNSVLQMLNSTPLADQLAHGHGRFLSPNVGKSNMVDCFHRVVVDMREQNTAYAVSPSAFKSCIAEANNQFDNSSQQDANEFLRTLLDSLHSELNECAGRQSSKRTIDNTHGADDDIATEYWHQYVSENSSIIVDMCAFQERSSIQCPACNQCSRSFAPSFGIELPIAKADRVSIEECFSLYCRREVLDESSLYSCPECHAKVRAVKQLLFYTLPDILFVTLKRFKVFGDFSNTLKNNEHVYFGLKLDLSPFMCTKTSNTLYQLVAIVNHQGNIHGGHYTSDCRGSDGVWCHFSDESVSIANATQNALAYMLCYERIRS